VKKLTRSIKSLALTGALIFALALSSLAFADETTEGAASGTDGAVIAQTVSSADSSTDPSADNTETQTIPDERTPLIMQPHEEGWSVVNLVASLLAIIIGVALVGLSMAQRQRDSHVSKNLGLTVFSMAAAVISTILFTSTEDVQAQMVGIDGFTVIHVAMLAVSVLCAYLSLRKDSHKNSQNSVFR
jgi:hypothetical protein